MGVLACNPDLLPEVCDASLIFDEAGDEQPASVQRRRSISVNHAGFLAMDELNSSIKPGGLDTPKDPKCHQCHGRAPLEPNR